jgi:hypothetical protein
MNKINANSEKDPVEPSGKYTKARVRKWQEVESVEKQ